MERFIIDRALGDGAALVALLVACVAAWPAVRDALRRLEARRAQLVAGPFRRGRRDDGLFTAERAKTAEESQRRRGTGRAAADRLTGSW